MIDCWIWKTSWSCVCAQSRCREVHPQEPLRVIGKSWCLHVGNIESELSTICGTQFLKNLLVYYNKRTQKRILKCENQKNISVNDLMVCYTTTSSYPGHFTSAVEVGENTPGIGRSINSIIWLATFNNSIRWSIIYSSKSGC